MRNQMNTDSSMLMESMEERNPREFSSLISLSIITHA